MLFTQAGGSCDNTVVTVHTLNWCGLKKLLVFIVGYVANKFRKVYIHKLFNMKEIKVKRKPVISFFVCNVPHLLILEQGEGFPR